MEEELLLLGNVPFIVYRVFLFLLTLYRKERIGKKSKRRWCVESGWFCARADTDPADSSSWVVIIIIRIEEESGSLLIHSMDLSLWNGHPEVGVTAQYLARLTSSSSGGGDDHLS